MGPRATETETVSETTTELQTWAPDYRLEALRLAVALYAPRHQDDFTGSDILHAADEFLKWLTADGAAARLTLDGPLISPQAHPSRTTPATRKGPDMAVTMSDTDQATYTVSETDSKGFPVSGDAITWKEDSGGAVVTTDGTSGIFVAVAPGTVQITATDGTLSASDTINVTAGGAASLVLGSPTVTPATPTA